MSDNAPNEPERSSAAERVEPVDTDGPDGPDAPSIKDDVPIRHVMPVTDASAHPPIRILGLRLRGAVRDYIVDFTDEGQPLALSLISGEISTGKTSVLEFIDYCLGASSHPTHPEVLTHVRAAQLAVEILETAPGAADAGLISTGTGSVDAGEPTRQPGPQLARYVIERAVGTPSAFALLFRGDHQGFEDTVVRRLTMRPAETDSLSHFLLTACGLAGLRVREAPTRDDSPTSILSFRDVMPLAFLPYARIGGSDLVFERQPPRAIKLRQVVDYMFGVSDDEMSQLTTQLSELNRQVTDADKSLITLRVFLAESAVPAADDIRDGIATARARRAASAGALAQINARLASSTQFASDTRARFSARSNDARALEAQLRERRTLLGRLTTLRSQYVDDMNKIELLTETQDLFDALSVSVCPACQSMLNDSVAIEDGHCSLCRTLIRTRADVSIDSGDGEGVDLSAEKTALERRTRELDGFVIDVIAEVAALENDQRQAQTEVAAAQAQLDASTRTAVAPFITERDALTAAISRQDARIGTLEGHLRMRRRLIERELDRERIAANLTQVRERRRLLEQTQRERDDVLALLGRRFGDLLGEFGFPKLTEPSLSRNLVPNVRGGRYDQVGSAGAMTLIALAWELAIFELAVEQGHAHPGFLLIDSPQKGLRPVSGVAAGSASDDDDIASAAASIVDRIYRHVQIWLEEVAPRAQVIIVDNEPPAWIDETTVVARYGGATGRPPYGLIEDAVD